MTQHHLEPLTGDEAMTAVRFADRTGAMAAETFRAWRIPTGNKPECNHARPLNLTVTSAATPKEALDAALAGNLMIHKDHLAILQSHAGRKSNTLWLYAIKRESKRVWRRDPITGVGGISQKLYPALLLSVPVSAFDPVEPWKWEPSADFVGVDRTLVEQSL